MFDALQNPGTWEGVGPIDEVWDAEHDDLLLTSFRWRARAAGRTWDGTATRTDEESRSSMTLELDSPEVSGAITVSIVPDAGGSHLEVTIRARSKGLLSGMFWGIIADAIRTGLPRQVEDFGDRF